MFNGALGHGEEDLKITGEDYEQGEEGEEGEERLW